MQSDAPLGITVWNHISEHLKKKGRGKPEHPRKSQKNKKEHQEEGILYLWWHQEEDGHTLNVQTVKVNINASKLSNASAELLVKSPKAKMTIQIDTGAEANLLPVRCFAQSTVHV